TASGRAGATGSTSTAGRATTVSPCVSASRPRTACSASISRPDRARADVLRASIVPLAVGIAILAFAVLLGGLAALFPDATRRVMSMVRTFAVVAAASIALLHLLPEAVSEAGWGALLAAALGAFGPIALERAIPSQRAHAHDAPTTALAMGYAA